MKLAITVRAKCERLFYPVCEAAKTFCAIAQSSALDACTLELIEALGYSITFLT